MNNQKELWNNAHSDDAILKYSEGPTTFASRASQIIKPHASILELGCGVGNDSYYLAKQGHTVLATDVSEVAIGKNRNRYTNFGNLRFEVLDLREPLSFNDNTFDTVYARLSLHYFIDSVTKRIFTDIHRVLKPGGMLLFMCKTTSDVLYGKGDELEQNMYEHEGHVRHFFSIAYAKECLGDRFIIESLIEKTDLLYGRSSSFIEVIAKKADL